MAREAMARYEIELTDDTVVHADDARFVCNGMYVELIPRKAVLIEGEPERLVINSSQVRQIQHKPIGFSGGWRFGGDKDSAFCKSEGSIGTEPLSGG